MADENETITVPRELFEELLEDAMELLGEWHWKKDEPRRGYDTTQTGI